MSGMYACNTALTGNYVGLQKKGTGEADWHEFRAYENSPMTLTESMLSTSPNPIQGPQFALSMSFLKGQTVG
jgi:hypothetical protein